MRSLIATLLLALCCTSAARAACTFAQSGSFTGTYDSGTGLTSASTMSVIVGLCAANASITLSVDTGLHSASYATRIAMFGANSMNYQLYTSGAMTTVLGNGTAGTGTETILTDGTGAGTFVWYFNVPLGQTPPVGTYTDSLGVTVTF